MSQHVRGGSFYKPSPTIELHELHSELRQLIYCIIRKILSMTVTKETIAQIIDNMPIKGNYVGITTYDMIAHPDIETRSQPSSEAIRQAGEVCANIDPMALNVDLRAAEIFEEERQKDPQSAASARRCLEIVSSLLHDITSTVYGKIHPPPETFEGRNETPGCTKKDHSRLCCPEYGRLHREYYRFDRGFKHSSSSIVGYWAETMIFGGPVLFARGRSGTKCSAAFIHPPNLGIIKLTDAQVKSILSLADSRVEHSDDSAQPPILPFTPVGEVGRLSMEEAVQRSIYREDGQLDGERRYQWSIGLPIRRRCGFGGLTY